MASVVPLHPAGAIKTTCPYCGVGCGVDVQRLESGNKIAVTGDQLHPANRGCLCSKGSALDETVGDEDRLLEPSIDGRTATWDAALGKIARTFSETIEQFGP